MRILYMHTVVFARAVRTLAMQDDYCCFDVMQLTIVNNLLLARGYTRTRESARIDAG